jgi:hypothetical protein
VSDLAPRAACWRRRRRTDPYGDTLFDQHAERCTGRTAPALGKDLLEAPIEAAHQLTEVAEILFAKVVPVALSSWAAPRAARQDEPVACCWAATAQAPELEPQVIEVVRVVGAVCVAHGALLPLRPGRCQEASNAGVARWHNAPEERG